MNLLKRLNPNKQTSSTLGQNQRLSLWLKELAEKRSGQIDLKLGNCQKVYAELFKVKQNEHFNPNIATITIAGTNGKGSTGFFLSELFKQSGVKVGWFSSPHILHFNERIQINQSPASDEEILQSFDCIECARLQASRRWQTELDLSYFEYATLAAWDIFKQQQVSVMVLEVGLGGRLDSTNLIAADIAMISSISKDHTHYLGDSFAEIAFEKAGIFRPTPPFKQKIILGNNIPPPAQKTIDERIKSLRIDKHQIFQYGTHFNWDDETYDGKGVKRYRFNRHFVTIDNLSLAQNPILNQNLCLALKAFDLVIKHHLPQYSQLNTPSFHFSPSQAPKARGQVFVVKTEKGVRKTALLDVAHNPDAVKHLMQTIQSHTKRQNTQKGKNSTLLKPIAIVAFLKDKEVDSILVEMKGKFSELWLVDLDIERALKPFEIKEKIKKYCPTPTKMIDFNELFQSCVIEELNKNSALDWVIFGCFALAEKTLQTIQNLQD